MNKPLVHQSRTGECDCQIVEPAGGQFEIEYCAMHEAAPDMLNLLVEVLPVLKTIDSSLKAIQQHASDKQQTSWHE